MHVSPPYSFTIACLICSGGAALPAHAADLDIKVTDVRAQQGSLMVAVNGSPERLGPNGEKPCGPAPSARAQGSGT